jgi:hypothetical protein
MLIQNIPTPATMDHKSWLKWNETDFVNLSGFVPAVFNRDTRAIVLLLIHIPYNSVQFCTLCTLAAKSLAVDNHPVVRLACTAGATPDVLGTVLESVEVNSFRPPQHILHIGDTWRRTVVM